MNARRRLGATLTAVLLAAAVSPLLAAGLTPGGVASASVGGTGAARPHRAMGTGSPGTSSQRSTPIKLVRAGTSGTIYLVSTTSCARKLCVHLARTSDLGVHEISVTTPPVRAVSGSEIGSLSELVFANVRDGIALEGGSQSEMNETLNDVVYATFNGARSWVRESFPAGSYVVSLASSSARFYAVVAHCTAVSKPCTSYRVASSPVGKDDWSFHLLANQAGLADFSASIAAVGQRVWISEDRPNGAPVLAVSSDAGAQFAPLRSVPSFANVVACELLVTTASSLWADCPTGLEVDFQHSVDGGHTWHPLDVGPTSGTGLYGFDPVVGDTAFISRGIGGGFYRTGGTDTIVKVSDAALYVSWDSLVFTNRADGLVIGGTAESSSKLLRTTDGGRRWRPT